MRAEYSPRTDANSRAMSGDILTVKSCGSGSLGLIILLMDGLSHEGGCRQIFFYARLTTH